MVVIARLIRLIRLDLQWRGRLHGYMWGRMGLGWMEWLSNVVGNLKTPSMPVTLANECKDCTCSALKLFILDKMFFEDARRDILSGK